MPKPIASTNVLLAIIFFLVLMLIFNIVYGCKYPSFTERFEDKVMTEASEEPKKKEPTKEEVVVPPKEEPKKEMTKKDTELFKAIVNEKFSTQELEKLVKAGILTEDTIEKFLNEMEEAKEPLEGSSETIEGFSCARDYATY